MSRESVRVKLEAEDKEQEWACSVKREPELGPELLQAPDVAWPRADPSAATCTVKQELIMEGASDECPGVGTEASGPANSYQDDLMQGLELEPVKEEEEEQEVEEEWLCGVSEAAARAGLYAGHAVKRELVLGPELLQAPHIATLSGSSASPRTASQALADEGVSGSCPGEGHPEQRALGTCSERISTDNHVYTCKEEQIERSALMAPRQSTTGLFPNEAALRQHERAHTADKPHKCHVCNKLFRRHYYLKIHLRIHTGQNLYECDVCNKQFICMNHYNEHKRIHTGNKPYTCDICNKEFSRSSNLIRHKRVHTGEKPFACDFCDRKFTQSNDLIRHKHTHTGTNTGKKPYKCDICSKLFTQSKSLTAHKRIHTGEKPYTCDACNKQFSRQDSLKSHYRTHIHRKATSHSRHS